MNTPKRKKMKLALMGNTSSPKLFHALQIAYGLCGSWEKIIVVGSSYKDTQYQHMGAYNTVFIPRDATPQRYTELLNICGGCNKEVIIFSTLSEEWTEGVCRHLSASYYEEVLKAHRFFFHIMRHFPRHVIACIDTRKKLSCQDKEGKMKLNIISQHIQQEGIERDFTTVLQIDKKGQASVVKDLTETLPDNGSFKVTPQVGAMLQDWCYEGKPLVPKELQQKIDNCNTLSELYQLLFDLDIEDEELFAAFTARRIQLNGHGDTSEALHHPALNLDMIPGGYYESY